MDLTSCFYLLKEALSSYQLKGRVYYGQGISNRGRNEPEAPVPMEVTFVGGSSKGKGKCRTSAFDVDVQDIVLELAAQPPQLPFAAEVTCNACGKVGHYARDCLSTPKGNGKGKGGGAPQGSGGKGKGRGGRKGGGGGKAEAGALQAHASSVAPRVTEPLTAVAG